MALVKIYKQGSGGGGGGSAVMIAGAGAGSTLRCGVGNSASGDYSMAWGKCNTTSGTYSTASGYYTTASGNFSTASGNRVTASGSLSTASGYCTTASGKYSKASGRNTTASSYHSTASGAYTTASGQYSTASGCCTTASGTYSIASGLATTASGNFSVACGLSSTASQYGQRSWANGTFSKGNTTAQQVQYVLRRVTPNASPLYLFMDSGLTEEISIKPNSMMLLNILTSGIETTGTEVATSEDYVVIKNVAGTTTLVHQSNIKQHYSTGGLAITISADDTNDVLRIQVTGTATTMRWMAYVYATEILYAT